MRVTVWARAGARVQDRRAEDQGAARSGDPGLGGSVRSARLGIRIAVGAGPKDILKLVLRQGVVLTASGLAIGLIAALALTRLVRTLLYGIAPTDPPTFLAVTLLLGGVALLASYLPGRRATRVDPIRALRYE